MRMEIKTKTVPVFEDKITAGNIIGLQVDSKGNKTEEPEYYLIGYSKEACYYYLTNIKDGVTLSALSADEDPYPKADLYPKEDIQDLIKEYDGKIYTERDAKLTLEIVQHTLSEENN